MPTKEIHIKVRTDGLSEVRELDRLLIRIGTHLDRLKAIADEAGVPLAVLVEYEGVAVKEVSP